MALTGFAIAVTAATAAPAGKSRRLRPCDARSVRGSMSILREGLCRSEQAEQQIRERRRQQRAVDHVQDAAEAGDQFAAVFYVGVALHEAFEEVAELADAADDDAEDEALPPR